MKKRLLSLLLVLVMVLSLVPTVALAGDVPDVVPTGAVAYVTDTNDQPIDAGEEGADSENDLGGGFYKTLEAAIAADLAASKIDGYAGSTITMLTNASITGTNAGMYIQKGQKLTIDLAGKTIFGYDVGSGGNSSALFTNYGDLTIKDSKDIEDNGIADGSAGRVSYGALETWLWDGSDTYTGSYASNVITNTNQGKVTIESGFIFNASTSGSATYCIDVYSGEAVIHGGRFENNCANIVRLFNCNTGDCKLTITDGIFKGTYIPLQLHDAGTYTVNISGGTFTTTDTQYVYAFYGWDDTAGTQKATVNITGGTFGGKVVFSSNATAAVLNISGADTLIDGVTAYGTTSITGGYYKSDVSKYVAEGYYCIKNKDSISPNGKDVKNYTYKIGTEPDTDYIAQILNAEGSFKAGYLSFDAALSAVKTGETIQLLKNASADSYHYIGYTGYTEANNFTVDLNGKTLDVNAKSAFRLYEQYANNFTGITFTNSVPDKGTLNLNSIFSINENYAGQNCDLLFKDITVNLNANQAIDLGNDGKSASIKLDNATFNSPVTVDFPIYSRNDITIKTVEGSKNKIYQPSESAYGIYGGEGDVTISGAGDLEIETECYGIYCNTGDVTITGSGDVTIFGAAKAVVADQQLLINSSGDVSITSDDKGVLCYGGATIGGTGNVTITGDDYYAIQVYDYYQGTDTYGLKVTNPNATFNSENGYAIYVEPYYYSDEYGYIGDNTSVIITGGTYNGDVYIMPLYGTTESKITGGTFNGDVQIDVCSDQKLEVSGGTFKAIPTINLYTMWGDSPEVVVKDGEFEKELKIRYGNAITGNGATITGGKFADLEGASIKDSYSKSVKAISGGIFANESYEAGGRTYDSEWTSCIAPGFAKGLNTDKITKVPYPYAVVPYEIKVEETTVSETTGEITSGEKTIPVEINKDGSATEQLDDKKDAAEAITEMLENDAVGTFVKTNIDEATKYEKAVGEYSFDISRVLEEAMKAVNKEEDGDKATVTENGEITIEVSGSEKRSDVDLDKKIVVELETAKVEIKTETTGTMNTITTVNGSTFDVTPMVTVTYTGTDGEEKSVTTKIPNEAITDDITFRLPISSQIQTDSTAIWHSNDASNYKKDYLGIFRIQEENGKKFVELSAREFSYYTYENLTSLSTSNVAAILTNAGYFGFDTLEEAIKAFNAGEDDGDDDTVDNAQTIILLKDIEAGKTYQEDGDPDTEGNQPVTEASTFDFDGKTLELDLNGHILKGASTDAAGVTVTNKGTKQDVLAATGVYANNVKAFVADGYDARTSTPAIEGVTNNEVINVTDNEELYKIVVEVSDPAAGSDRAPDAPDDETVDVYMDDVITVDVYVEGARFFGADITLEWDTNLFEGTTTNKILDQYLCKKTINVETTKVVNYKFVNAHDDSGTHYFELDEYGRYHLGQFTFKALPVTEDKLNDDGKVPAKFYVTKAEITRSFDEDNEVEAFVVKDENKKSDTAYILLKPGMKVNVTPDSGKVYRQRELNLLKDDFSASADAKTLKDLVAYNNLAVEYCVLTKEDVEGTPLKDDSGNLLYYTSEEKNATDTAVTEWPAYENGKEPKVPTSTSYTKYEGTVESVKTSPVAEDADVYVIFYRVTADGYATVEGSVESEIKKKVETLKWSFNGTLVEGNSATVNYDPDGFTNPTATYPDLDNVSQTVPEADIIWTAGPDENNKTIKDVGVYTYTAKAQKNYEFDNAKFTVTVKGLEVTYWALQATDGDTTKTPVWSEDGKTVTNETTINAGKIWRDGASHAIATLVIDDENTVTAGMTNLAKANATITYELSTDEGLTWEPVDEIPEKSEVGKYMLRMTVKADNYETLTKTVTFEIANPSFVYEIKEYVSGWSLLLVYTDETVTFKYDTQQMYDETSMGYKYGSVTSGGVTQGGKAYAHVYGIVVEGKPDPNKLYASNAAALSLDLPTPATSTANDKYDVNSIGGDTCLIDINDLSKITGIYNVQRTDLTKEGGNLNFMQMLLRADVNRDKIVDTLYDAAPVQAYLLNQQAD